LTAYQMTITRNRQFDLLTKSRGFVPSGPNNVHEAIS